MAAGISGCSDIVVIKINAKRKIRVEKIELESIMSGTTIGYLSALIFFAIMKKIMVTVRRAGTFYSNIIS